MGLLIKPQAATFQDTDGWLHQWLLGGSDESPTVNERNAMRISTVWKCVRARAETFGMIPKKVFERQMILGKMSQVEAVRHPLYSLIHTAPNPFMTSMAYFELMSADLDLWGNNYSYIERSSTTGRLLSLWRVRPDRVRVYQDPADTTGRYWYDIQDGSGAVVRFYPEEILHIRGLGFDGICGYSPIQMQKRALEWNKAAVTQNSALQKNASRPSFLVSVPGQIKDSKAKKALVENLTKSGKEAGKGVLVEGAVDVKMLTINPEDAQFIETVQYQEEDICGIFRVPPHKVGILRRSTNNNIEHQDIEWVRDSIQPICKRVEEWVGLQLLSDGRSTGYGGGSERERFFLQCELKGLLRGDTKAQTEHIEKMIDKGVYSQNDSRDYLGLSPVEDGDRYWINSAYIPIDKVDEFLTDRTSTAGQTNPDSNTAQQDAEMQIRFQAAYAHVFRDAVGRTISRAVPYRERVVPSMFERVLSGLAEGLEVELPEGFFADYLAAMAKRSKDWKDADAVAKEELRRAVEAFLEKGGEA